MFNIGGGELIAILIIALIVLGPDKLPDAVRRAGRLYGELRRMSSGFQAELREVLDEPMREVRSTTDLVKGTFTSAVYDHDLEAQAAEAKPSTEPGPIGEAADPAEAGDDATQGDRPAPLPAPGGLPDRSLGAPGATPSAVPDVDGPDVNGPAVNGPDVTGSGPATMAPPRSGESPAPLPPPGP